MNVGYELAPVLKAGRDCIVVHHVGAGHGGNISVHEINIFSIAAGKLKLVLATQEEMLVAQFGGPATETTDERSTFVFLPGKSAHPYVVEQTRSTTVNEDKLTVERRYFRWSAAAGMYVPSKFRPVLATQN
jgi:hypothetical protein